MRIAIFGGSFNPIHTGHAMIASAVAQSGLVDEVWIMVSPQNPLKAGQELMPEEKRLEMARLVAEDCPGVVASDFEFGMSRPSYTYKTLLALKEKYPEDDFFILIGSDNWQKFGQWRNSREIIEEFGVLIYERPDYPMTGQELPEGVRIVKDVPMALISSTYVRKQISENRNISFIVPDKVRDYLLVEGLKG